MAIAATAIWEIQNGGSDTLNGGGFDPGQAAGMFTDGAATVANTAAPVFTSASYSFVVGDIGAWVYIAAGANWTPGWYVINGVGGGAATLGAAIAAAVLSGLSPSTALGCATVASPTGATWAIDYSQQAAREIAYTDLTSGAAGATATSAAFPFAAQRVGNMVQVTGGVNATVGVYTILSVAAGTVTFDRNWCTGAVAGDGTGGMGGALASPGIADSLHVAGNIVCLKYNATPYTLTRNSAGVAGGRFVGNGTSSTASVLVLGYETVRGAKPTNRPKVDWGVNAGSNYAFDMGTYGNIRHVIVDGKRASFTLTQGIRQAICLAYNCKVTGCAANPYNVAGGPVLHWLCESTDNAGVIVIGANTRYMAYGFNGHDNTVGVFTISTGQGTWMYAIFDSNGGAGISSTGASTLVVGNCDFYNNTGAGIDLTAVPNSCIVVNTHFEANTTYGLSASAANASVFMLNVSFFGNGTAKHQNLTTRQVIGEVTVTASPYVNAAGGDFRKKSMGAGAVLIGVGAPDALPGSSNASYPDIGAYSPASILGNVPFGDGFV